MSHESHGTLLDELVDDARALDLEARPDDEALVARAVVAGRARHDAHARRRTWQVVSSALGLAAIVALAWLAPWGDGAPTEAAVVQLTLPAGDVLVATGDARFDVLSSEGPHRVVRLQQGAMLFDVAPLDGGASFEVETSDARVRVRGTVFAVQIGAHGTHVRVYEGHVEVERESESRVLAANESDGVSEGELVVLDTAGRAAAARRRALPRREITSPAREPRVAIVEPVGVEAPVEIAATVEPGRSRARRPTAPDAPAPPPSAPDARALLEAGRLEEALLAARERPDASSRFVEADALRALGRIAEAADLYERIAGSLEGVAAHAPAFLAAELRMRRLHDPVGALRVIDANGLDADGSPIRERGLSLRADALDQLGRTEELARVAEEYVEALPEGPRAGWMRAHLARD